MTDNIITTTSPEATSFGSSASSLSPSAVSQSRAVSFLAIAGLLITVAIAGAGVRLAMALVMDHAHWAAVAVFGLSIIPVGLALFPVPTLEIVKAVAPKIGKA